MGQSQDAEEKFHSSGQEFFWNTPNGRAAATIMCQTYVKALQRRREPPADYKQKAQNVNKGLHSTLFKSEGAFVRPVNRKRYRRRHVRLPSRPCSKNLHPFRRRRDG